jgi:hypothetical protein
MDERNKIEIINKAFNVLSDKKFKVVGRHAIPFEKEYIAESADRAMEFAKNDFAFWDEENKKSYEKEDDYFQIYDVHECDEI